MLLGPSSAAVASPREVLASPGVLAVAVPLSHAPSPLPVEDSGSPHCPLLGLSGEHLGQSPYCLAAQRSGAPTFLPG